MGNCALCKKEILGRKKYCDECNKIRQREKSKRIYANNIEKGIKKLRYGKTNCAICGKEIIRNRPNQTICYDCYKKSIYSTVDNYNNVARSEKGNTKARQMVLNLGINLKNMVVHHLDENPNNNVFENFLILSVSNHSKLHSFLRKERIECIKINKDIENAWPELLKVLTDKWLKNKQVVDINIKENDDVLTKELSTEKIYRFI